MDLPELRTWVGGVPEQSDELLPKYLYDPNTQAELQQLRASSLDQVDRTIASADALHRAGGWRGLELSRRAEYLTALARALEPEAERIAHLDSLNSGVPISVTREIAGSLPGTIDHAVQIALERGETEPLAAAQGRVALKRVPWGPTAIILPWNSPAAVAVKKMAYALLAGAPVIMKPSSFSPWSMEVIAEAVHTLGLPEGTFSVVLGGAAVGQKLAADPRVRAISLTGSTPTGRAVAISAAPNFTRLQLELGSNNPVIVRGDADLEETASQLFSGMTKLNGQWCEAPRIVYADRGIYEGLLSALHERLESLTVGSSVDGDTTLGPLAHEDRLRETEQYRQELLASPGISELDRAEVPANGWFFAPTVLHGEGIHLDAEIFAPMIVVRPTSGDAEAIALANSGQVGLAAYVFSQDLVAAEIVGSALIAGEVKINGTSLLDMAPQSAQSFFGSAGIGGHGDADLLDFFSGKQVIGVDLVDAPI